MASIDKQGRTKNVRENYQHENMFQTHIRSHGGSDDDGGGGKGKLRYLDFAVLVASTPSCQCSQGVGTVCSKILLTVLQFVLPR
jgi:hypothetical protein